MKKLLAICAMVVIGTLSSNAQSQNGISPYAIGIRANGGYGYGSEVSFQMAMGGANRLELDLGWGSGRYYSHTGLYGTYQWVNGISNGWNWYYGFGAGVALWGDNDPFDDRDRDGFNVGVLGQIGIEYSFPFPLLLSVDARPGLWLFYGPDFDPSVAISARYQF